MKKKNRWLLSGFIILLLLVSGWIIIQKIKAPIVWTPENSFHEVSPPPVMDSSTSEELLESIDRSLHYYQKAESAQSVTVGEDTYSNRQIQMSLSDFKNNLQQYGLNGNFFAYLRNNYDFYKSAAREVLFTGYYEAMLKGSMEKSDRFKYPLYSTPDDLIRIDLHQFEILSNIPNLPRWLRGRLTNSKRVVPYHSREEIDFQGELGGRDLEIYWIDNPIGVFFLHIQGSGIIQLESGETVRVNYDESNGHPYRAIGRWLVENNILPLKEITMQSIRQYLEKNPQKHEEIFSYNPSYVFFRTVKEGPMGAIQEPLTPFRSIATDLRLFPKGAICYIETEIPTFSGDGELTGWEKHSGFYLNQDTGGAIKGPGRVDIFCGKGEKAEWIAGHMKQKGKIYVLIKK